MFIRRQSARVKKSGRFSKIGGLLASVPSISRPSFRAACLRKIVWELFRTGTLATQAKARGARASGNEMIIFQDSADISMAHQL